MYFLDGWFQYRQVGYKRQMCGRRKITWNHVALPLIWLDCVRLKRSWTSFSVPVLQLQVDKTGSNSWTGLNKSNINGHEDEPLWKKRHRKIKDRMNTWTVLHPSPSNCRPSDAQAFRPMCMPAQKIVRGWTWLILDAPETGSCSWMDMKHNELHFGCLTPNTCLNPHFLQPLDPCNVCLGHFIWNKTLKIVSKFHHRQNESHSCPNNQWAPGRMPLPTHRRHRRRRSDRRRRGMKHNRSAGRERWKQTNWFLGSPLIFGWIHGGQIEPMKLSKRKDRRTNENGNVVKGDTGADLAYVANAPFCFTNHLQSDCQWDTIPTCAIGWKIEREVLGEWFWFQTTFETMIRTMSFREKGFNQNASRKHRTPLFMTCLQLPRTPRQKNHAYDVLLFPTLKVL